MHQRFATAILFALLFTMAVPAFAQVPPPPDPAPAPTAAPAPAPAAPAPLPASFTVSLSPAHLILPVGEVMAEYNVNGKLGVAGILGAGSVTVEDALGSEVTGTVFEVGAQGNYYLWGGFRKGLHVGAEALYLYADMESGGVTATGAGLSLSGYLGYKHTFSFGLALILQIGYGYTVVSAESEGESDSDSKGNLLLNFNVGWTF
jgi:hypothetical protein